MSCNKCNRAINQGEKFLKCDFCDNTFHAPCEDLDAKSVQSIIALKQKTGVIWFCLECKKLDPLNSLRVIPKLIEKQTKMEHDIEELKALHSEKGGQSRPEPLYPAIEEFEARKKNESKITVTGLEVNNGDEKETVTRLLHDELGIEARDEILRVNTTRKPGAKPTIFVEFVSSTIRNQILHAAKKLKLSSRPNVKNVYINPVYTKFQMEQIQKLKNEAKMKSVNGKFFVLRDFRVVEIRKKPEKARTD